MIATRKFFGTNRAETLDSLVQWLSEGPAVCVVEGFAGTGKTSLGSELMRRVAVDPAWRGAIPAAMTEEASLVDLLLTIAAHLSDDGVNDVEKALFDVPDPSYAFVMARALREYVLIVVDEAQFLFDAATGRPLADFAPVLASLANRADLPGRLLLLSNRIVDRTVWPDVPILTLRDLAASEAEALLDDRLAQVGIPDAVPPERKADILTALAHNPRAIEMLATALRYEPLDNIVGQRPDLWDVHDREFSRDFLEVLERLLLVRIIEGLPPLVRRRLFRLSVYRQDFEQDAIHRICAQPSDASELRKLLIDRFLLAHHFSWYSLNPLVREIALARLKAMPSRLRNAHGHAANYYLRYFSARRIVTPSDRLKGSFAELRYHLTQAERTKELEEIARRYSDHLKLEMIGGNLRDGPDLDDRIRLLSAVLERPGGPEALEYHLARCLDKRRGAGDLEQAAIHAERATTAGAPPAFWVLRARIEAATDPEAAIAILRQAIAVQPMAMQLYDASIRLLLQADRIDDAVAVLTEAIKHVGPGEAADETYSACSRALCNAGRTADAMALLHDGCESPAAERGVTLYTLYARLLSAADRDEDAIAILQKGLKQVPPNKNAETLYVQVADVLQRLGRVAEAETLLRNGIEAVPRSSYHTLYHRLGELLRDDERVDAALEALREGYAVTPPDSVMVLYVLASDILEHAKQLPAAIEVLREATAVVPVTSAGTAYTHLARKLARYADPAEAIELLREGARRTQARAAAHLRQTALSMCAALQDWTRFDDILRNDDVSEGVAVLGEILRLNARGEYAAAARISYPDATFRFELAQAFALLSIGQPEQAWSRIERAAGLRMRDDEEAPSTYWQRYYTFRRGDVLAWLTAFIQLRCGRMDDAARTIAALLGRPVAPREVNEATLLRFWDGELGGEEFPITHFFPILPPSLTGLPAPVYRPPFGPSQMAEPRGVVDAYQDALEHLRSRATAEGRRTDVSCFISYAWGNLQHEAWVRRLTADLEEVGIEVLADWKTNSFIGASVTRFVDLIPTADYAIVVGTPLYVEKYQNRAGHVVAAEFDSIAERLIGTEEEKSSVLPIILQGTRKTAIPAGLAKSRIARDFTSPQYYRVSLLHLVRSMWRVEPDITFFDIEARVRPMRSAS
jgi:tetratricopeptide (TPR) repeat protein